MRHTELVEGTEYAVKTWRRSEHLKATLWRKNCRATHELVECPPDERGGLDGTIVGKKGDRVVVRQFHEAQGQHVFKVEPREARSGYATTAVPYTFEYATYRSKEVVAPWDQHVSSEAAAKKARLEARKRRAAESEAHEAKRDELRERVAALGLEGVLKVACTNYGGYCDEPRIKVLDPDALLEAIELRADVIAGGV